MDVPDGGSYLELDSGADAGPAPLGGADRVAITAAAPALVRLAELA